MTSNVVAEAQRIAEEAERNRRFAVAIEQAQETARAIHSIRDFVSPGASIEALASVEAAQDSIVRALHAIATENEGRKDPV